jgi:exodeoxyribonuclease VII large subunit
MFRKLPNRGLWRAVSTERRKVLSVSELTAQVKRLLEKSVGSVWVTGEVTNLRAQSSGHMYFTLKDAARS